MKIEDLDILRPEIRMVRLGGKDIDVSFIPCGITFEIDKIVQELGTINQETILQNGDETKRAFDLSVRLCAAFCSHRYPELDEAWFMENVDAMQLQAFTNSIKDALMRAYAGVGGGSKNGVATKVRRKR